MRSRVHMLASLAAALGGAELFAAKVPSDPPPRRKGTTPNVGRLVRMLHTDGTFNAGRNRAKRLERARLATLKGLPGGWKKAARTGRAGV